MYLLDGLDWRPWAYSSIIIVFYCPSCARPCYTLYDILLRHRSTLYFCGYDRLLSMDPPCSFVAMDPLDLIWRLFAYWATMIVSSVIHMLDPPVSLWRCFVYGRVCSRDQFFWHLSLFQVPSLEPFDLGFSALSILSSFLYNVFRLSSSPLTSHIRGHLLYTRMAPLRPSADFPYVGAEKGHLWIEVCLEYYRLAFMEYISAFISACDPFSMISSHVGTSWKSLKKHLYWRTHILSFVTPFDLISVPLKRYFS